MSFGLESETIIRLLLSFAPKHALKELELDESTREEWVAWLESERKTARGQYEAAEMSSAALYYATRKRSSAKKLAAEGSIKVDFWTLFMFAETVKAEEFDRTESLLKEIALRPKQRRMKAAQDARVPKYNWQDIASYEEKLLNAGRTERELASIIKKRYGVSPSAYRDWRRKRKTTV